MAFFPDVQRGDKVQHLMLLENNVRHIVNSLNGFGSSHGKSNGNGTVRIQIWNAGSSALVAGQPVAFDGTKAMCGDAVPAVPVTDTTKPWGVCVQKLEKKALGDCIIAGPATVSLSGTTGDYAEPVANGTGFTRSETGTARVLFAGTKSIIVLGNAAAAASETYNGPFALSYDSSTQLVNVAAGYISRNGEFSSVSAATLSAQTGTVCVCSTFGSGGTWGTPTIAIATPSKSNFPIGYVTVSASGAVSVCSYRVPVAMLFEVGECTEDE